MSFEEVWTGVQNIKTTLVCVLKNYKFKELAEEGD